MSESKGMIVLICCEEANCGVPDPGEEAFDYVYRCYKAGQAYADEGDDYPIEELIDSLIPYNNYRVATIWTQLQLYNNDYFGPRDVDYIQQFQMMLFDVTREFVNKGIERVPNIF
tara:strand:+ start:4336 stop:4680 length:345 start_codon:yes stop_codon:yes gene_type:complete